MISSILWVQRGKAAEFPKKVNYSEDELKEIQQKLGVQVEQSKLELQEAQEADGQATQDEAMEQDAEPAADLDFNARYNMDNYDDESGGANLFSNIQELVEQEDEYLQPVEEDEEQEELRIDPMDNLLLAARTEDEVSSLEVYVYEQEEDNLYVHHDILLPSFPLCLEWLDYNAQDGAKGNFVAIGTFDPQVEIWNLDEVDSMFPAAILGQIPVNVEPVNSKKSKHGPARVAKRVQKERHVDAVMTIAWNPVQRNLVATGSADTTIKLWDLQKPEEAIHSYNHHTDKVQAVVWNPKEPTVLLSGGYDKRACVFDSRQPETILEWKLTADVECMKWDPHSGEKFFVSLEDGIVQCFNAKVSNSKPIFTLHAHDLAVTSIDVNPYLDGFFVTGSADKTAKLWHVVGGKPSCIASRELQCGRIFSCVFNPDSPLVVGVAGSNGKVVVWNVGEIAGVRKAFPQRQFGTKKYQELIEPAEEVDEFSDEDEEMQGDDEGMDDEDHV